MRQFGSQLMVITLLCGGAAWPARAADDVALLSIQGALDTGRAGGKLDGTIKFYFGHQPSPRVRQNFGQFVANEKTNGFAKSEGNACTWVFLSALISLQSRAKERGADSVINIESFYKKHVFSSETQFECHKGFLIAGVALRGDMVRTTGK